MPHGYEKTTDIGGKVMFRKQHKNGEKTVIDLDKQENGTWVGYVKDAGMTKRFGSWESEQAARTAAKQWMQNNPKGVTSGGFDTVGTGGSVEDSSGPAWMP